MGVLEHHEWYDGTGYPLGTKEEDIPLFGRIIKLVDVYDALTSKRPYHEAQPPADAVEYLMAMNGVEFDPGVLSVFLKKVAVYPIDVRSNYQQDSTQLLKTIAILFFDHVLNY